MDYLKFIKPELLVLVPVLYFFAYVLKTSFKVDPSKIPIFIGITGIILSAVYVMATTKMGNYQEVLMAVFTSIVQGFLCAGAAVYSNQIYKQNIKQRKSKKNKI